MISTDNQDLVVWGEQAFLHAQKIEDPFTRMLVRQGLVDALATNRLRADDSPLFLDLLDYALALTAVYTDRTQIAAMTTGKPSPIDAKELHARITSAEKAGSAKRGADAFAHCETQTTGVVRELLRWGLGVSAERLARDGGRTTPVDLAVQARLLEGSFEKTLFVRNTAEGKPPMDFI